MCGGCAPNMCGRFVFFICHVIGLVRFWGDGREVQICANRNYTTTTKKRLEVVYVISPRKCVEFNYKKKIFKPLTASASQILSSHIRRVCVYDGGIALDYTRLRYIFSVYINCLRSKKIEVNTKKYALQIGLQIV